MNTCPLLHLLLSAQEPLTVEGMSRALGQSTTQTLAQLEVLRDAGAVLEHHPQQGYWLVDSGLGTWADFIKHLSWPERRVDVYRSTTSTQDAARRLLSLPPDEWSGAMVVAHEQTAGRGRLGRRWIAPAGACLTFSRLALRGPSLDRFTLAASVAVAEAVEALSGVAMRIKWPNDVVTGRQKIAGVLVEAVDNAVIIGIGVNVDLTPELMRADPAFDPDRDGDLPERVASFATLGLQLDRLTLLAEIGLALDAMLLAVKEDDAIVDRWRARCSMLHQHVTLRHNGGHVEGEVLDVDPDQGLILRTVEGHLVHLPASGTTVV